MAYTLPSVNCYAIVEMMRLLRVQIAIIVAVFVALHLMTVLNIQRPLMKMILLQNI